MRGAQRGSVVLGSLIGVLLLGGGLYALYGVGPSRNDLSTYLSLVVAVVGTVLTLVSVRLQVLDRRAVDDDALSACAASLADRVDALLDLAAAQRGLTSAHIDLPWRPVRAGGTATAPGWPSASLPTTGESPPEESPAAEPLARMVELYAAQPPPKLVVVGESGVGKTAVSVLLGRLMLRHHRHSADSSTTTIPVPLDGGAWRATWDARGGFVAQLGRSFPDLFAGRRGQRLAEALVDRRRVTLVLDGFDEMAEEPRRDALTALQRTALFPWVLLSRPAEFDEARGGRTLLDAMVVELQELDLAHAVEHLAETLPGVTIDPLLDRLRSVAAGPDAPRTALAVALRRPLAVTLIRDSIASGREDADDLVRRLLEADARPGSTEDDIVDILMGGLVERAYQPDVDTSISGRLDAPHSVVVRDPADAGRVLRVLARRVDLDAAGTGTASFGWWRTLAWTCALPRAVVVGVLAALAVATGSFVIAPDAFLGANLEVLVAIGTIAGTGAALAAWATRHDLTEAPLGRWRSAPALSWSILGLGICFGFLLQYTLGLSVGALVVPIVCGAAIVAAVVERRRSSRGAHGPVVAPLARRPTTILGAGLAAGTVSCQLAAHAGAGPLLAGLLASCLLGLVLGLRLALGAYPTPDERPSTPYRAWRRGRWRILAAWFTIGLPAGALMDVPLAFLDGTEVTLGFAFFGGIVLGLIFPQNWVAPLAFLELAVRTGTPVRLARFLDDAHRRGLLRSDGDSYRFWHDRFLHYLLTASPTPQRGAGVTRRLRVVLEPAAGALAGATLTRAVPELARRWEASLAVRVVVIGAGAAVAGWLGLPAVYPFGPWHPVTLAVGLAGGIGAGCAEWAASGGDPVLPATAGRTDRSPSIGAAVLRLGLGVGLGALTCLDVARFVTTDLLVAVASGLSVGIALWLGVGLVLQLRTPVARERWRRLRIPYALWGYLLLVAVVAQVGDRVTTIFLYRADSILGLLTLLGALVVAWHVRDRPFAGWDLRRDVPLVSGVSRVAVWLAVTALGVGLFSRAAIRLLTTTSGMTLPVLVVGTAAVAGLCGVLGGLLRPRSRRGVAAVTPGPQPCPVAAAGR